ncbi:DUF2167 domain-containing protein [Salmonella enterica]|nr:putative inner membrane protein [Salmonella enterica subsp. enterica serovar Paratyphi A str. ZJ98-53]
MAFRFPQIILFLLAAMLFCPSSYAEQKPTAAQEARKTAVEVAVEGMSRAAVAGPTKISLGDKATLNLPEGFTWIPAKEAAVFMREIGNYVDDEYFYGLVFKKEMNGFISIEYDDSGYVKDDDAKNWDADELMDNLRKGTKEANKDRIAKGIEPIEIIGWIEKPTYDATNHRLIWSAAIQDIGTNEPLNEQGVNYNTYLLGREGYFSLNLVTDRGSVDHEIPLAKRILSAVKFNSGQRYADFNESTDKIAEYGLAALIGGIAAKKVGLLAMLGIALLKFWKVTAIGVVAVGALARKLLTRKKDGQPLPRPFHSQARKAPLFRIKSRSILKQDDL